MNNMEEFFKKQIALYDYHNRTMWGNTQLMGIPMNDKSGIRNMVYHFADLQLEERAIPMGIRVECEPSWFTNARKDVTFALVENHNCDYLTENGKYYIVAPDEETASLVRLSL